jgi:hypothetical protein
MSGLITIINSKFSDKSGLGEWYKDRLKVCLGCDYNSENKASLSLKEKAIVLANFGKPSCLACGCEIAAKASVETENCGIVKLGKESKWVSLNLTKDNKFIVVNTTDYKASITPINDSKYELNYGEINKGSDSLLVLIISKKDLKVKKLVVSSSCGCTIPERSFDDKNDITLKITYDTQRIGSFDKTVSLSIFDNKNKQTKLFFNIKGIVKQ